jgi:hypothetical protein
MFDIDFARITRVQQELRRLYDDHGLVTKVAKMVLPSTTAVTIGYEVDGFALTVGLPIHKLVNLQQQTAALLTRGFCSGRDLSRLIGDWTWAALARRPVLSVFRAVYRFINVAGDRTFALWRSVQGELRAISNLAPLMFSSIGAPLFRRLFATDASSFAGAVVATRLQPSQSQSLARLPLSPQPDHLATSDTVSRALSARWQRILAYRFSWPQHINALELQAVLSAVNGDTNAGRRPSLRRNTGRLIPGRH